MFELGYPLSQNKGLAIVNRSTKNTNRSNHICCDPTERVYTESPSCHNRDYQIQYTDYSAGVGTKWHRSKWGLEIPDSKYLSFSLPHAMIPPAV